MRFAALLLALLALVAVPGGGAAPVKREVLLGVLGNADHFDSVTGQQTRVGHVIMAFGQATGPRLDRLIGNQGEVPMIGFSMKSGGGILSSRDIAQGKGDAFLVDLNRAVSTWPGRIYIRPWGEMNGHWNTYCAFNQNGSSRGAAHSTANFRKAFARAYLIVHGAPNANAELKRLGMPPVSAALTPAPFPRVRMVWNPQGYGSPNLAGNTAAAYYPGDKFVDVVGNDLYNIGGKAEWGAAEALYQRYKHKPHSFPEWANWGIDDPGFVKRMADFVKTHPKVELIAWYYGVKGSEFDLARYPKSRAAYKQYISPLG
ncbi:MAG: hypothetical protein WD689_00095 [Gaiellaceae bacterium]